MIFLRTRLSELEQAPLRGLLTVAYLGLLFFGIATSVHLGFSGQRLEWLLVLIAGTLAWAVWQSERIAGRPAGLVVAIGVVAVAGGWLVPVAPLALTFVGVAALASAMDLKVPVSIRTAVLGPVAVVVSWLVNHHSSGLIYAGVAAASAGYAMGLARRQASERVRQEALVAVERQRVEVEHERAALLAERNRLAREIHDVLAHTLSALSVRLSALDAVLEGGGRVDEAREEIERLRSLVSEGLGDARRAVKALREDSEPLGEQLARLCSQGGVELSVTGRARPLEPEPTLALYRAAQEAVTNVIKHAPGAEVAIGLEFGDGTVAVTVDNTASTVNGASPLAASGSGYGLDGIRERVLLLGGELDAGPLDGGGGAGGGGGGAVGGDSGVAWRVRAWVPA